MPQPAALPDFLNELQQCIAGDLRTDQFSRILYSTDASIYKVMPHGVFLPQHEEDVQAAVELAAKFKIPILPRAGGSSLAGQAVNEALILDTSRHLTTILEVNEEERWVRVQPGRVLDELNLHLQAYDLQFGPDPASSNRAGMGGIVSNNSTGSHSILYGMTADHVLEIKGFLSDGSPFHFAPVEDESLPQFLKRAGLEGRIYSEIAALTRANADIIRRGTPRHWRRCGGYNLDRFIDSGVSFRLPQDKRFNLANLVCGAEGTLAVITEIKLNLVPRPQKTALGLAHFKSLQDALTAVPVMLETDPSVIELLDNLAITLCEDVPQYARLLSTFIEGQPNCILVTEYYGESDAELKSKIENLSAHLQKNQIDCHMVSAFDDQMQQNVWTVRKVGLGLLMSIKGDHKPIPFIEDAAVPPQHLAEYIDRVERFCNDLGTKVAYYAHASAGCLHVRPLINAKVASDIQKLPEIATFSADLVGEYGGALSSEHGDGRCRSWLNERFFGKDLFGLYKQVKQIFDPHNILNPGNVVDLHTMTDHLRYGEAYSVPETPSVLDFSDDQGFHRAVEMCNGAGVCRKRTTGTMCPSFMVTREEVHSTRGRANALRAALSGTLPPESLTSKEMYEVMDLCIECKACKAECPSSVDMAKIKFEFLARYHQKNGISLRSRIFAGMPMLSRITSGALAGIANWKMRNKFIRKVMRRLSGITEKRPLPDFAKESFLKWFSKRGGNTAAPGKQVVLFHDTFNTFNDPHIAAAAVEVLEAAGFEILLPGHKCCGRPMISKGLVDQARKAAKDTVSRLAPFAEKGIPIIGLEPSCLLSLRDEYLYLLPDDPQVKIVAEQSFMFEEFIAKLADEGNLDLSFKSGGGSILLHGHCHQKALIGTAPSKKMLALAGFSVEEVDSGCCGMAGSFGYEAEHYDISIAMAERQLLPKIRQQPGETIIAAAGTSCRHQISHGCSREALHPVEIIRNALQ